MAARLREGAVAITETDPAALAKAEAKAEAEAQVEEEVMVKEAGQQVAEADQQTATQAHQPTPMLTHQPTRKSPLRNLSHPFQRFAKNGNLREQHTFDHLL